MNRIKPAVRAGAFALAFALIPSVPLLGQTVAPAANPSSAEPEDEESITLSPFVVEAEEDTGYAAKYSLAGTRIRTELKDVGAAIQVVTKQFLEDTNSRNAEDLLVYTTGTEVAGQGGNFLGQGDGAYLTATDRTSPIQNTRVRGLDEADNTRDFFTSDIPWDSYNVGRVDLQRGANSILFGIGSPAGIINSSLNGASFRNTHEVEYQFGSFGSQRATADFNRVIIPDQLAVRVSLLADATKYRQEPAFKDDERMFGAVKWTPKLIQTGTTEIRANYEKGNILSNNPRGSPPMDAITPWFDMGKPLLDPRTVNDFHGNNRWLGAMGNRVWDGVATAFENGNQGISFTTQALPWPNRGGNVSGANVGNNSFKGIRTYDGFANATFPEGAIGAYKARSLSDASIFNFYDSMLEGDNKREWNDFDAYNIAVSQTFLNNKVGIELVYDRQEASWGHDSLISNDGAIITVDMNAFLLDGSPNPNVGRPLTLSNGFGGGSYRARRERETKRVTAFGELNFEDMLGRDSKLGSALGRHVFTANYSDAQIDGRFASAKRYFISRQYDPKSDRAANNAARDNIFLNYLGPSLLGSTFSSARGLGLRGVAGDIDIGQAQVREWNNVTNQWVMVPLTTVDNTGVPMEQLVQPGEAYINSDNIESQVFVWQGYLFDGAVVPLFAYREDEDTFLRKDAATDGNGGRIPNDPGMVLPAATAADTQSGDSKSYGLAVHTPDAIRRRLPGNVGISLYYNKSNNFKPDAGRRDILGQPVASPSGETKDYGIALSAFDDRLTLRVTKYDSKNTNATLAGAIGGQYLIGAVEAWGQQAAYRFKRAVETGGAERNWPAGDLYGFSSSGGAVIWRPAGPLQGSASTGFTYTQAQLDAAYAKQQASINAWYATQVPQSFQQAWALDNYSTTAGLTNFGASGLVVTGDTVSEGYEYELIASNILAKGLSVSFNASKTSAQRANPAKSYVDWVEMRWAQFQGPAGDMRLWGSDDDWSADAQHGGETARGKFARETMAGYNLFQALANSDVPELRPWRFNVVANYNFQSDGLLKGTNVGISYRWQDQNVVGFPVVTGSDGVMRFDVDNPYMGSTESIVDLWVGYKRKLGRHIDWRCQVNVRNAFGERDISRVTVQPDGSPGGYRINEPRTIAVTNTFSF
ncbi:MAG TPA: TonB-dependent receptor plug domain-containing protein [Opitutaceae bacterium]|nr:TonB-dependent receptor plug domain-containing protein [Opitutaceae bacterium]